MNCLFCNIITGDIPCYKIYENDHVLAFLDIHPNSDGHCVVVSKQHVKSFSDANNEIVSEVAMAKLAIAKLYQAKLKPLGFNYVSNDGAEAFQEVFHYHEHIVPKYKKDEGYSFVIKPTNLTDLVTVFKKITDN